jgi:hypothetical protein
VDINTTYVAATRTGAAFRDACPSWTSISALGENLARTQSHARTQTLVPAAGTANARRVALPPVPAPTMQSAAATANEQAVTGTRKQTVHVNKTRFSAGGYGAMGPHPEREPA